MSNAIAKWLRSKSANWLRSFRLWWALRQGNTSQAKRVLKEIQRSDAKLSWLEELFQNRLAGEPSGQEDREARNYREEIAALKRQVEQLLQQKEQLEREKVFDAFEPEATPEILVPNPEFIGFVTDSFQLRDLDEGKIQATGICDRIFDPFEANLADFVREYLSKLTPEKLEHGLQEAREDLDKLKRGIDPQYSFDLSPHVYLMRYFVENVYCNYLAWFLIYKAGLLPAKLNILDIAAGPGTAAYGLALLLQSSSGFFPLPQMHVSYYSLEQQDRLQFRGLQFWRRYIEALPNDTNAYFRFVTDNIFAYERQVKKLPQNFFNFIVISHCFFVDLVSRFKSYETYRQIFENSLSPEGYVLLIVQGAKLFISYETDRKEDLRQEKDVIAQFLDELGLTLEWYKYIDSTGLRTPLGSEFGKFARESLPVQKSMSQLQRQYLGVKYNAHYAIDDYVILAKKKS
ncbi:MAG: photosystem II assembly protein [Oscillatoria sp. SIO1A7]|nr:photosystem II assembly protein [Oscillatoria sp. SIO1A7]